MDSKRVLVRYYDRVLLEEAAAAANRASHARQAGKNRQHAASTFVAIVTAATSAEFYLSEILAHLEAARIVQEEERERIRQKDRVWKKFNALTQLFGTSIDREPFYRPYRALVVLRNCLVHRSADFLRPGEWPSDLEEFRDVIPHVRGDGFDWTSQVLDADTAVWAARTAKTILDAVHAIVPDPGN